MEFFNSTPILYLHRITGKDDLIFAMYVVTSGYIPSLIDLITIIETRGELECTKVLLALDATETYDEAIHELFTSSGGVLGFQKALEKKLEQLASNNLDNK